MDEIDQLRDDDLYELFSWPELPASRALVVGIANTLDLTEGGLPHLKASGIHPHIIHFAAYTKQQLLRALQTRLQPVLARAPIMDTPVLTLVANKVAEHSGDIRKCAHSPLSLQQSIALTIPP